MRKIRIAEEAAVKKNDVFLSRRDVLKYCVNVIKSARAPSRKKKNSIFSLSRIIELKILDPAREKKYVKRAEEE